MVLCRRSYEKEKDLPQKKIFFCKKLYNDYLNKFPNIKSSLPSSVKLGKLGKKIISYYIKDNEEKEKIMNQKDDYIYKYFHSKPYIEYNKWKFSNHIINEFSRSPSDKIHSFSSEIKEKPKYLAKPFRRPKIYGDYLDKNIFK